MRHTVLFVLGMSLLIGCQSARVAEPLTQRAVVEDDEGRLSFWHALPETGLVSNDDAFHALALYFDGQDEAESYDQRVAALKGRGWLPDNFNAPANDAIKRGTLAVALVEALNVDGGVMMRVLGPSPRYATRELAYMNLFPMSSPQQTFSGTQLVELISKVEDWQRAHPSLESPQPPLDGKAPPPGALARTLGPRAPGQRVMQITARRQQMLAVLMAMIGTPTMFAQAAPPAPGTPGVPGTPVAGDAADAAAAPADPNALPVVVTALEGIVQVRAAEDQPWQAATVGQNLTAGAEFRTGPKSSVRFTVGDTQTVTLDRLGTVKVLDALRRADGAIATDVGMKYGRSTMQVQAAGVEHQSRIRSPGATLSVRGSVGSLEDVGTTLRAAGLEGDVAWARGAGRFIVLPPSSEHEDDDTSTAENRLADGTHNPRMFGTTPLEQFLHSYFTNGTFENSELGIDTFRDLQAVHGVISGPPPIDNFDPVTLVLPLFFRLFDNGNLEDGDIVTLTVRDSSGTVLGPANVSLTFAGQTFSPDVAPGSVEIRLTAVNEGTSPPNTGGLQILSQVIEGTASQSYILSAGQGDRLIIQALPGGGNGEGPFE